MTWRREQWFEQETSPGVANEITIPFSFDDNYHGRRSWGDEGDASPLRPKRGWDGLYNHPPPPYKGDEQMKSILHNTQIITPEEIVSCIDDEIIFSRKFE